MAPDRPPMFGLRTLDPMSFVDVAGDWAHVGRGMRRLLLAQCPTTIF